MVGGGGDDGQVEELGGRRALVVAGGDLDVRAADLVGGRRPGDEARGGVDRHAVGVGAEAEGDRVALGVLGRDLVEVGHADDRRALGRRGDRRRRVGLADQ